MRRAIAGVSLLAVSGCSVLVQPDLGRLRGDGGATSDTVTPRPDVVEVDTVDPPVDVPVVVDVPTGCVSGCDDGIPCTIDRCNTNVCVNTPDNTRCGPDATCNPMRGCVPNMMMGCRAPGDCDDRNPCTQDLCTSNRCSNPPVDEDMDGSPARMVSGQMCAERGDCDDRNRAINPMAAEVCDMVDNNCNGMIDDAPMCMSTTPTNVTCSAPIRIDLTTSGAAMLTANNARVPSTVQGYCNRSDLGTGGELWYTVVWPSNRDLFVEAQGASDSVDPVLFANTMCGQPAAICNDDMGRANKGSRIVFRTETITGIGTRTVNIAVDSYSPTSAGAFTLRLRTQMSVDSRCGNPFVMEGGGAVRSVAALGAMDRLSCSGGGVGSFGQYDYYSLRSGAGMATVSTSSGNLALRRDCASMATCISSGNTFMTSGTQLIGIERPSSPYVITFYTP